MFQGSAIAERTTYPDVCDVCGTCFSLMDKFTLPYSLLAYGLLCAIQDRHEQAHVLLKSAVDIRPKYVLSLTVLVGQNLW